MDLDDVWRSIDSERSSLADLLEELTPAEWETPSLCDGWRVRDVAAHLTLAHMSPLEVAVGAVRARGSFDRMIRDTARRAAHLPVEEYPRRLRAMVGSRRRAPLVTPLEPLVDVLVHGQDVAVPLGRERPVPHAAGAAAATRVWEMGFPFRAQQRLRGLRLAATDVGWSAGSGPVVAGPISAVLLLLTGREETALARLGGEGAQRLAARRAGAAADRSR